MQENCVSGVTPHSRVEETTLIWYLETATEINRFRYIKDTVIMREA